VVSAYERLGIELQLDCTPNAAFNAVLYGQVDVDKALEELDQSIVVVKDLSEKPSVIRFGEKYLHDSKKNLLQLAVSNQGRSGLSRHIEVTMQLMNLERTEFNSKIRFSYSKSKKAQYDSGETLDIGSSEDWVPEQKTVDKDIASLRKFKEQILAQSNRFPDVYLYHGNDFFNYEIDEQNKSYAFSSANDDNNLDFF
jgi:hypothetical protein